jgi:hypothetical protein
MIWKRSIFQLHWLFNNDEGVNRKIHIVYFSRWIMLYENKIYRFVTKVY